MTTIVVETDRLAKRGGRGGLGVGKRARIIRLIPRTEGLSDSARGNIITSGRAEARRGQRVHAAQRLRVNIRRPAHRESARLITPLIIRQVAVATATGDPPIS